MQPNQTQPIKSIAEVSQIMYNIYLNKIYQTKTAKNFMLLQYIIMKEKRLDL